MLIKVTVPPQRQIYTYQVSKELASRIDIGCRLQVNFRGKLKEAIVVEINSQTDPKASYQIKEIPDHAPVLQSLDKNQIDFFKWIAQYYQEDLSALLNQFIPKPLPQKKSTMISLVSIDENLRGKKQKAILEYLQKYDSAIAKEDLIKEFPKSTSTLNTLLAAKLIKFEDQVLDFTFDGHLYARQFPKKKIDLNSEQRHAVDEVGKIIDQNKFESFLLYGVTGSGKTEVYLELAEKALAQDKGVIILVPEIALTPQLIDRFAARLKENFAIWHSNLRASERWNAWQNLLHHKIKVLIGVRSAIFAPIHNLGLIIVDEEHDSSYKQSDNFRYHAKNLAIKRSQLASCPIILGSATPSLETIYNYQQKKYTLLKLRSKHGTRKNKISVIDLNKMKKADYASPNISKKLAEAIAANLQRKCQSFILYNRRGFASYLECRKCAASIKCPNCDLTLTFYQKKSTLLCHACGYHQSTLSSCTNCSEQDSSIEHFLDRWEMRGAGTEKIDQELQTLFPNARIARLDRDLVRSGHEYRQILDQVREQKIDILIGTQMIAKGHDLPFVTLVGVIDCDVGLHFPDFRASEKVFQLLMQVSGRAGRSEIGGEVIFQTRQPNHPSVHYAQTDNYLGYINNELSIRRALNYPPFSILLRVIISAEDSANVSTFLNKTTRQLQEIITKYNLGITILGPVAAPLHKLRRHYRWHFLLKSTKTSDLQKIIFYFKNQKLANKKIRIGLDLDPQDLL